MRILVAEDNKDLNKLILKTLSKNNYSADGCFDGQEALSYLNSAQYDLLILDVMMPKLNGFDLIKRLRNEGNDIPVLFLTAKDDINDRVKGLDLGGDDYLIKPFNFDELLARIRVLTRRYNNKRSNRFRYEDLIVDIDTRTVIRNNRKIKLYPKEYTILEYLIKNPEIVLTRNQIEDQIWNHDYAGSSNNIDVYISKLRKKIDENEDIKLIHTIKGVGFVLKKK